MKEVTLYSDGACKGNPGPGGWAAILVYKNTRKEICGGERDTTNNRMELTAVIEGLRILKQPCLVSVITDSQYVVSGIEKGWAVSWEKRGWIKADRKPVLNPDLWKELLRLTRYHTCRFTWIKGHAGHSENERCDSMASECAENYIGR